MRRDISVDIWMCLREWGGVISLINCMTLTTGTDRQAPTPKVTRFFTTTKNLWFNLFFCLLVIASHTMMWHDDFPFFFLLLFTFAWLNTYVTLFNYFLLLLYRTLANRVPAGAAGPARNWAANAATIIKTSLKTLWGFRAIKSAQRKGRRRWREGFAFLRASSSSSPCVFFYSNRQTIIIIVIFGLVFNENLCMA